MTLTESGGEALYNYANKFINHLNPYNCLQIINIKNTWNHITVWKQKNTLWLKEGLHSNNENINYDYNQTFTKSSSALISI